MKKLITVCAAVAALALFAGSVQAGGCGYGGYGGYSGFNQSHMSSGFGGYGFVQPHQDWHSTSHYDYHPAQVVPHGNHLHVNPGHYVLHAWDDVLAGFCLARELRWGERFFLDSTGFFVPQV